ncbi:MAG TPA: prolyl oligopeptidase family serine peptidase [Micropepsaceae bacterium]|nr:prolyl oligopeptidase family serine peptidase [Micropepsaceae bacterium]
MSTLDGPRVAAASGAAAQLIVLCHGYGSDGNDLIGLAPHWRNYVPHAAFVAPNAPQRHPMGPGYQWFPLSRIDPEEALRGTEAAAPLLNSFIDAELARVGLPADKLALVGFSQGTMVSLYVGLRRPIAPAAVVGFSGVLVGSDSIPANMARPPVLLVHGDADQVVPPQALLLAANGLAGLGVPVQWHMSKGLAHGIDAIGLALAGRFLNDCFSGRAARSGPVTTLPDR